MKRNEALGEFLETLEPLELRRVIAKGHMLQVEYRESMAELEAGLAHAEKLLRASEQVRSP